METSVYYTSVYFLVCGSMGGGAAVLCSLCLRLFGQSLSLFLSPTLQITQRQVHTIMYCIACVSAEWELCLWWTWFGYHPDEARWPWSLWLQCQGKNIADFPVVSQPIFYIFLLLDWLLIAYIVQFSALLSSLPALACDSTWVTSFL